MVNFEWGLTEQIMVVSILLVTLGYKKYPLIHHTFKKLFFRPKT